MNIEPLNARINMLFNVLGDFQESELTLIKILAQISLQFLDEMSLEDAAELAVFSKLRQQLWTRMGDTMSLLIDDVNTLNESRRQEIDE